MNTAMLTAVVTLAAVPIAYALAAAAARALRPATATTPTARAAILFVRGIAPTAGALLFAFGIVLPAFVTFEPPHEGERVGLVLLVLAALGATQVVHAAARLARMIQLSRCITAAWRRTAQPLPESDWGLPTLAVDAGFPVVAVSGLFRPTLFVDHRILAACSPAELAAIAAHERAHVRSLDNLRRLLIGSCAGPRSAAAAGWRESAEQAADERAADNPLRAVDLASALVKVARLAPVGPLEATALSTIHDGGALEARIHRLLRTSDTPPSPRRARLALAASIAATTVVALNWEPLLRSVHAVAETAVKHLR